MLVVESHEIRNIENLASGSGVSMSTLMENAGKAVAEFAGKFIKENAKVCIICGTGNNGGDGFVAAGLLVNKCSVTVVMADGLPRSLLASNYFSTLPHGVVMYEFGENRNACVEAVEKADIIIDAVYGTGFNGSLKPNVEEIITCCNANRKAVKIAVDVPSGIICDSGSVISECFHADYTLSFTALKPLHVLYPSMDYCGKIAVCDVGIPKEILANCGYIMETTDSFIEKYPIRERKKSAHKGTNGTLLTICGSYGMAGAAMLAGEAALRTGVGLLRTAVPRSIYGIAAQKLVESVFVPLEQNPDGTMSAREYPKLLFECAENASAVLIGCGIGVTNDTKQIVSILIQNSTKPMVVDADALNCISQNPDILRLATAPIIITPHPREMARLIDSDVQTIQAYRYDVAKDFAMEYRVTVVLKGANTIIATPEGKVYVNLTGNNGMAKGGSGDVLSGMMSSLLAQGLSAEKAAVYAVYYHGLAGDKCRKKLSARSMLPSDLIKEISFS